MNKVTFRNNVIAKLRDVDDFIRDNFEYSELRDKILTHISEAKELSYEFVDIGNGGKP